MLKILPVASGSSGNCMLVEIDGRRILIDLGVSASMLFTAMSANGYAWEDIDAVLIEEPESHLSYMKMLELVELIRDAKDRQVFISTHSDLIATRLNLKKCFLLNSSSARAICLSALPDDTADFFMKAPDNNMLQFVLSKKSILVEGDAEYILMEALYKRTLAKEISTYNIGVIAVDGKCFKRYLDIAIVLENKVAVITDNDRSYADNITQNYADYFNYPNQFTGSSTRELLDSFFDQQKDIDKPKKKRNSVVYHSKEEFTKVFEAAFDEVIQLSEEDLSPYKRPAQTFLESIWVGLTYRKLVLGKSINSEKLPSAIKNWKNSIGEDKFSELFQARRTSSIKSAYERINAGIEYFSGEF